MDSTKEMPFLKDSSPTMIRRLRSSFLAFCILTLCASIFLLWNYGASIPHAFHGIEDVDEDVQGGQGLSTITTATVTVIGSPTTLSAKPRPSSPPSSDEGVSASASANSNLPYFDLVWWLKSFGRVPGDPLFFMIVSNTEMAYAFNMYESLERSGRGENLIVMCLEKACLQAPEVITFDVAGMNKNSVKIAASIQLLNENFNFIFIDPGVFLTGTVDPFSKMATMEQDSWDLQFFPGPRQGASGIDTSFFWARPSQHTKNFFKKIKENWTEKGDQDLSKLMNVFAAEMSTGAALLNIKVLGSQSFKSWEDYMDWESTNFNSPAKINDMLNKTAALQMTCVEPSLKIFLAKNFGGWDNGEGYYTSSKKYIGVKGLEGDAIHASKIIGFAAKVAMDTQRSLIFPSSAILTQKRKNDATGASDYVKVDEFPAYRIVDPSSIEGLGLPVREPQFLNNRARYARKELSQETIIMGNGHSVKDPSNGQPVVVKTIKDKPNVELFWLDMGSGRWWDLDASGAMAEYTKDILRTMRACKNADEEHFECNKRCT